MKKKKGIYKNKQAERIKRKKALSMLKVTKLILFCGTLVLS
jgi:hypothetical protein